MSWQKDSLLCRYFVLLIFAVYFPCWCEGSPVYSPDWRDSALCQSSVDISSFNKRELKEYIHAKDRLFFAYLDLYTGDKLYKKSGGSKVEYDLINDELHQARELEVKYDDQSSKVTSTYLIDGTYADAKFIFRKLRSTRNKSDGNRNVAMFGAFKVTLRKGASGGFLQFELKADTNSINIVRVLHYRSRKRILEENYDADTDGKVVSFKRGKFRKSFKERYRKRPGGSRHAIDHVGLKELENRRNMFKRRMFGKKRGGRSRSID